MSFATISIYVTWFLCYNYAMNNFHIKLRKIKKTDQKYILKWLQDKELIKLTSGRVEKSVEVLVGYFLNLLKCRQDFHYLVLHKAKAIGHLALIHKTKKTFELNI